MSTSLTAITSSLHATLSLDEFYATLQTALADHCAGTGFTLFFFDADQKQLNLAHSSLEEAEPLDDLWQSIWGDMVHAFENNRTGPMVTEQDWPKGTRPVACATLHFQDSQYGLMLLHSPEAVEADSKTDMTFRAMATSVGIEIVKLQLYEAATLNAQSAHSKIQAVYSTAELLRNLDLETLLTKLMELSLDTMKAQVGSIILKKDDGLQSVVEYGLQENVLKAIKLSDDSSFLEAVFAEGNPLLIKDMSARDDIDLSALTVQIQSLLCIPLCSKTQTIGLITIVNTEEEFHQEDFEILSAVGNLAASALENSMLQEAQIEGERMKEQLTIARTIQTSLQPKTAPVMPGFEVADWSLPCDETGGDYYDYIPLDEGRVAIMVGDATGHGLGAAVMMLGARSSLLTLLQENDDLSRLFYMLNNRIEADSEDDKFMTLFCGLVNFKERTFRYSSAGHDGPLWCSPSRDICRELPATGLPLGILPAMEFMTTSEVPLRKGDILVMGTDGIWEAINENGEVYGKDRLIDIVMQNPNHSAKELCSLIQRSVQSHIASAERRDDITLVIGKVV